MDSDTLSIGVAAVLVYLAYKWLSKRPANGSSATGAAGSGNVASLLGFRPRNATPAMIDTVQSAFPSIPRANIHYDLLRTGSAELTVNRLLERGFLDAPPQGYWRAFPAQQPPNNDTPNTANTNTTDTKPKSSTTGPNLIERFNLQSKISSEKVPISQENWDGQSPIPSSLKGKGRELPSDAEVGGLTPKVDVAAHNVGGVAGMKWEATAEARQAALQSRKEAMILAARQRMLAKKAAAKKSEA